MENVKCKKYRIWSGEISLMDFIQIVFVQFFFRFIFVIVFNCIQYLIL